VTTQTKTAAGEELPAIPRDVGGASTPASESISDSAEASSAAAKPKLVNQLVNRLLGWLAANATDIVILGFLGALTVLVRVLTLEGVDTGGDAIEKWHFVRQWFYRNTFHHGLWNHHMARIGVNGVAWVAQRLFGRGPGTYYAVPIFAAVGESCFVYACGKRLESRLTGVIGTLLLIYFSPQIRAGSQVMPEIFSGLYGIMTAYVFLRYADAAPERKRAWLIAMGVAAFVSYLGKETSVFFFPGFAVAILLVSRKLRDVFIFGGVFVAGVVSECLAYTIFTDYKSRWQIVVGSHGSDGPPVERTFWQLFDRFSHLEEPWKLAFFVVLPCCIGIVAFRRDLRAHAIVAMEASYIFLLTFLVRRVTPAIVIWQSFWPRYFDPTAPFTALIVALFAVMCFRELIAQASDGKRWAWLSPRPGVVAVWVVGVCVASGLTSYLLARPELDENALVNNAKIAAIANDTYRRNLPFLAVKDVRGLWAVYNVFIDDRLLARKGQLPLYDGDERAVDVHDRLRLDGHPVLVKNPNEYNVDLLRHLRNSHCYIEVSTEGGRAGLPVRLRPFEKLPPECDEELYRQELPNSG
jgi:4-amino-4-deoxy-L-arabinose transferase-like glycosyltransferase